jgi:hypothetical protein
MKQLLLTISIIFYCGVAYGKADKPFTCTLEEAYYDIMYVEIQVAGEIAKRNLPLLERMETILGTAKYPGNSTLPIEEQLSPLMTAEYNNLITQFQENIKTLDIFKTKASDAMSNIKNMQTAFKQVDCQNWQVR